jgi:hypothetical protein
VLQNGKVRFLWTDAALARPRRALAVKGRLGMGDLNMDMANVAKIVLFISACASLFGLGVFLFRDQIFSQTGVDGGRS